MIGSSVNISRSAEKPNIKKTSTKPLAATATFSLISNACWIPKPESIAGLHPTKLSQHAANTGSSINSARNITDGGIKLNGCQMYCVCLVFQLKQGLFRCRTALQKASVRCNWAYLWQNPGTLWATAGADSPWWAGDGKHMDGHVQHRPGEAEADSRMSGDSDEWMPELKGCRVLSLGHGKPGKTRQKSNLFNNPQAENLRSKDQAGQASRSQTAKQTRQCGGLLVETDLYGNSRKLLWLDLGGQDRLILCQSKTWRVLWFGRSCDRRYLSHSSTVLRFFLFDGPGQRVPGWQSSPQTTPEWPGQPLRCPSSSSLCLSNRSMTCIY